MRLDPKSADDLKQMSRALADADGADPDATVIVGAPYKQPRGSIDVEKSAKMVAWQQYVLIAERILSDFIVETRA